MCVRREGGGREGERGKTLSFPDLKCPPPSFLPILLCPSFASCFKHSLPAPRESFPTYVRSFIRHHS